ncbi:MAG: DUF4124 domain-containing protein [Pseudomonadota bacterium]
MVRTSLRLGRRVTVAMCVLGVGVLCMAAQGGDVTYFRWTDENGTIHITDQAPKGVDYQEISVSSGGTRAQPIPQSVPSTPPVVTPSAPVSSAASESFEQSPATPTREQMTLEQLDARCEAARQARIAPLRAEQIASCQEDGTNDPDWCERYFADYGNGGRRRNGRYRPRMFEDIDECLEAASERRRRKID